MKICTMNCGPHRDDTRTAEERQASCEDCDVYVDDVYIGEVRPKEKIIIHVMPLSPKPKCEHEWLQGDRGVDLNGSCTKCGMSFQRYIHMECP